MRSVEIFLNPQRKQAGAGIALGEFTPAEASRVRSFHKSFPDYTPTPLVALDNLAKDIGVGSIQIKDESKRLGLNAFKVLGGSYAIGRILAEKLGRSIDGLTLGELTSPAVRKQLGDITFVTATDGNHGRGVAWTAQQLGMKAVVFMPKGSALARQEAILATGAECTITEFNYDDAVRHADKYASEHNGIMVQDTAWEGYEDIPRWIMQGYMTMALECMEQIRAANRPMPTHLFLQAGVGSYAGSTLGSLVAALGDKTPTTVIVEPHVANCIHRSMLAMDGKPRTVTGDMQTIMAGLACGEPSTVSWGILRDYAAASVSCPDYIAANGMRILAAPKPGDAPVVSGESGAVTTGLLEWMMTTEKGRAMAGQLNLSKDSHVLLISTEGDTSPEIYRDIVWYGKNSDEER
ncbi:2,3-diaminopropionate ammonia-lyase [uncultured delta proteobacterium]|uniref:2,3-diaminopropionate ammonia-lyase n=1 Tax=uncultured delta proteobacterium TaxID=34034 RepID=A0A212JBJ2_9DELT|nr:2,3-diaminopropionate ammonia-lyase [uncultured delta proteobacterium]